VTGARASVDFYPNVIAPYKGTLVEFIAHRINTIEELLKIPKYYNFKLCLVSHELQGQDKKLESYKQYLKDQGIFLMRSLQRLTMYRALALKYIC